MRVDDAIKHFKGVTPLAKRLGVLPSAVTNWRRRYNGRMPELYARRVHELTRGKLKFDRSAYLGS